MLDVVQSALIGLPVYAAHVLLTLLVWLCGVGIHVLVTPYREVALARHGNVAAGITLSGAFLAMALPLAASLARSVTAREIVVWGVIVVAAQIFAFLLVSKLVLRDFKAAIERGDVAAALVLASVQLSISLFLAGAVG
ncbi:MAG: DUF350 domain-containing protein [Alphaproteobacteria bacterium]|nr:DUF350 domain-containing protein [Alphaproteobacteria bacterium]